MNPHVFARCSALALLLVAAGCSRQPLPTSPQEAAETESRSSLQRGFTLANGSAAATEQVLAGYRVRYDGRVVAGGRTTFNYTLIGTATSATLSHLTLQIPSCAGTLVSSVPASGSAVIGFDPSSGLDGITWGSLSLGANDTKAYAVSFAGDIAEGVTRIAVKSGSQVVHGVVPGPCGGFTISGSVFDDANSSATQDGNELGIGNVTVKVVGPLTNETVTTAADGSWSVRVIAGAFTVSVDYATAAADFNEQLESNFTATGAISQNVTVGPDRSGVAFGFKPNTTKIVADFDAGLLQSSGQDAGFWTKAVRAAIRNQSYAGITPTALRAMLAQIEGQFLAEPYSFTDGRELQEALAILTSKPRDAYGTLYKQLFIAELNDAGGKGIIANPELQDALLAWGESLLAQAAAQAAVGEVAVEGRIGDGSVILATSDLSNAILVFQKINNSRPGGDIPE